MAMENERENHVYQARLAEQAERYHGILFLSYIFLWGPCSLLLLS